MLLLLSQTNKTMFSNLLINWYLQNKRDLPWRKTKDAYKIWLSEIILQQTRVAQGLPYYISFVNAFPTVQELANAPEEKVLKLWQGLGYYSRARNLHAAAKYVVENCNGVFPTTYKELIALKGVGEYTAAAVASFSSNEKVAVVDGNVFRVLARFFGIESDISIGTTKKEFQQKANSLIPTKAADFNQAIMEFGALQCVPKSPNCSVCPLQINCVACATGKVDSLPVKTKKTKVTNRFLHYIIVKDKAGNFILNKRETKGIWQNLYEFPVFETEKAMTESEFENWFKNYTFLDNQPFEKRILDSDYLVHKLSHQALHIRFVEVRLNTTLNHAISLEQLLKLPFPIVLFNFIERVYNHIK